MLIEVTEQDLKRVKSIMMHDTLTMNDRSYVIGVMLNLYNNNKELSLNQEIDGDKVIEYLCEKFASLFSE